MACIPASSPARRPGPGAGPRSPCAGVCRLGVRPVTGDGDIGHRPSSARPLRPLSFHVVGGQCQERRPGEPGSPAPHHSSVRLWRFRSRIARLRTVTSRYGRRLSRGPPPLRIAVSIRANASAARSSWSAGSAPHRRATRHATLAYRRWQGECVDVVGANGADEVGVGRVIVADDGRASSLMVGRVDGLSMR